MDPGVQCPGMKVNHPGYLWSKHEGFLTSGCRDMKHLHIKGDRRGTGTGTRTTEVTTIALLHFVQSS